jgi:hypothetical protein
MQLSIHPTAVRPTAPRRRSPAVFASNNRLGIQVMRFDSVAPELINARLAMVGYTWGAVQRLNTGETFTQQFEGNIEAFALATLVVTVATLVPIAKGLNPEDEYPAYGTELLVGRVAMLAFATMLVLDELA